MVGGEGRKSSGSESWPGTALREAAGGGGMCPCLERRRRTAAQPPARRCPPRVSLLAPTGERLVQGGGVVAERSRACPLERGLCALGASGGKKSPEISRQSPWFLPDLLQVNARWVPWVCCGWEEALHSLGNAPGGAVPTSGVANKQLNSSGVGCDPHKHENLLFRACCWFGRVWLFFSPFQM